MARLYVAHGETGLKICLHCSAKWASRGWQCPLCGSVPQQVAGVPAFSPELAKVNIGFEPRFFSELASIEAGNFWFRSRNRLISWALQRYFPHARNFLEIGCGTGFVLSGIEQTLPHLELFGSEIFASGLMVAAKRLKSTTLFQMDARNIPFENEFNVIGAFDVLEHIEEDELVLSQMHNAVSRGGGIMLTVPQHPRLWSCQDKSSCHVRRYTASELKNKTSKAGFKVVRTTSFVFLLLPLMVASRIRMQKREEFDDMELRISGATNMLLERVLDAERALIRWGVRLPAGGSLLLIATKC